MTNLEQFEILALHGENNCNSAIVNEVRRSASIVSIVIKRGTVRRVTKRKGANPKITQHLR